MAIINFTNKSTGQASTFETGSGKFLRLEDSQGAVHLFAASEITLSGANGTVTAGQTIDLSTLLTVPSALAGKTVSWRKVSGSAALTLSGHTVTAESGATASDSATFTATVAGISATVTVTATAAAPATYDITVPTVTGATITVLVNDAAYTSGKLTHGDSVRITVAAQTNYNLTSSSVTMGGQPVTGSNGEYNINSVTGAVVISATAEVQAATSATFNLYNYNYSGAVPANGVKCTSTSGSSVMAAVSFDNPLPTKPVRFVTEVGNPSVSPAGSGNRLINATFVRNGDVWNGTGTNVGTGATISVTIPDSDIVFSVDSNGRYVGLTSMSCPKSGSTSYFWGKWFGDANKDTQFEVYTFYTG